MLKWDGMSKDATAEGLRGIPAILGESGLIKAERVAMGVMER